MIVVIFQHLRSREKTTTTTTTASDEAFIVFRPFQSRQLRDVAKKNARRRRRRLRQTFRREKETKRSREINQRVPQHPKERKKENDGRTDKSTRSRDAYLELRFRPVRLGPVDPAERVLFARGVRSRRVFGGGHFDICCSGTYVRRMRIICRMAGGELWNKGWRLLFFCLGF